MGFIIDKTVLFSDTIQFRIWGEVGEMHIQQYFRINWRRAMKETTGEDIHFLYGGALSTGACQYLSVLP